jgi:hypothetical protein
MTVNFAPIRAVQGDQSDAWGSRAGRRVRRKDVAGVKYSRPHKSSTTGDRKYLLDLRKASKRRGAMPKSISSGWR